MNKLNIHGWEHLSGSNFSVVAVRKEVLRQLEDVPEPHRSKWEKRLKSKLDHSHFSVRLEIYLHNFFKERGCGIDIEPELPGTNNRPDFRVSRGEHEILVEAKTLVDPIPVQQQDTRLRTLADGLSGKLNRTVSIHPYIDLPPSLPNRHIAAEIEKRASDVGPLQEFRVADEHQGYPYELEVTIMLDEKPAPTADIGRMVSQAQESRTGQRMRKEIVQKAGKYGKPGIPLVIVVWPQTWLYEPGPLPDHETPGDDYIALVGDEVWPELTFGEFTRSSKFNGAFCKRRQDGSRAHPHVSAVAVYQFSFPVNKNHHLHDLRIFHNASANRPLSKDTFQGIPQCTIDTTAGQVQWE